MIIKARDKDLGDNFHVRRVLPFATHRMVGPFIFFDHMGPVEFKGDHGMDVRPHPHINLATVTFLFDGRIHYRDSLGSDQMIEPGAINWMTAGKGIVHSERSPHENVKGSGLHGIQLWVALPEEQEECEPSFNHHKKETLPELEINKTKIKLLLGKAFGKSSPVKIHSDLFYAELQMPKGSELTFNSEGREAALYVVNGALQVNEEKMAATEMVVADHSSEIKIVAHETSKVMLIGGSPVGPRFIFWNFVSSSQERIEAVKEEWAKGPRHESLRFKPIPGDDKEHIPLPTN